ncbi:SDR family oxidoreductase, partial [Rhodococcus sp. 7Tela_A2]|uniref:SDR family oxidoreductase n=1 Tax=Rhodococcus sp. 7Tela_A2 TaxID=3093744 RepID=UPI003BB60DF0
CRTRSPFPGGASYIASKAAVSALVETMALEYREDHIRVNALLPVVIDTPANRAAMPDADTSKWSQPADVAKVIEFLISDAGSPVTGALIPVTNVGGGGGGPPPPPPPAAGGRGPADSSPRARGAGRCRSDPALAPNLLLHHAR